MHFYTKREKNILLKNAMIYTAFNRQTFQRFLNQSNQAVVLTAKTELFKSSMFCPVNHRLSSHWLEREAFYLSVMDLVSVTE